MSISRSKRQSPVRWRQRRRRSGFPLGQRRSPSMTDRGRQSAEAGLSTMRPK
ncbi:sensor domain-containing protein, partial [Mycobacterium tuberculosis]